MNVLVPNDDTEGWDLLVAVEDGTGKEVFRTEEVVPRDIGDDPGEALIEDAFRSTTGTQFAVHGGLDAAPAGTFEHEVTCPADDRFSLLVEHAPDDPADGEPVDYVADRGGD